MLESMRRVFGKRLASRSVRSGAGRRLALETLESRLTPSAYTGNQAMNLYRLFLDRVPEERGLEAWVGALESERITVGQMAEGILRSPEHASRSVEGAYVEYLGRTPDSAGLAAHVGAVQRGVSPEWVDASILGSNEYFARHGSGNIPYVQALYLDVLGREADEPGLKAHVGALAKGSTRAQVAYTILTSAESGVQLAGQAYWEVLGREGAPEELAEWSGVFTRSAGNHSGGLTAVFAGVAGSPEGVKSLSSASMLDNPIPAANGSIRALLPRLEQTSDTGPSNSDNVTFVRTPTLTGGVEGPVSQVLIFIDGRPVDLVPVEKGVWKYTVPAEKALSAGSHTIRVQPRDGSGKIGSFSNLLRVTTVTEVPNAPTIGLAANSDSGAQGDGKTTDSTPTLRGVASPGLLVDVSIDGLSAGQVKADSQTGAWELKAPRLANGVYDIEAVAINTAGLRSSATGFEVTINGERTVVLDGTDGNTVELMASHLLGQGSQGFIVTQVLRGTLQRWSAAENTWVTVPPTPVGAPAPTPTWAINAPAIRKIAFNEVVRWTPARGDVGPAPAFSILPMDTAGGLTAPRPEAGTVPGKLVDARVSSLEGSLEGLGQTITWKDPTDGCGCGSTRYSIEVTREDGQTLVYSVPRTIHGIPIVEGGLVQQAKVWGATKTGAGEALWTNLQSNVEAMAKASLIFRSSLSFIDLGTKARSQLANSPTETQFTTSLALGNHANLVYLQVDAVPDATEAALNLPAGTPMIVSSDSSKLTPKQLADLKTTPIYASHLFPGTVNGEVQPDQLRAHFQAGERLRFSGTVDAGVRTGATIVVESAQNLGDGSLGPWLEEARIPVGADGGFSHDYVVPYGMNSVRTRLEYRTQPAAPMMRSASEPSLGATSSTSAPISTPIDLSGYFNAFGITTPPWQVPNHQGFDGNGNYFNSDYTGPGTKDPIPGTPINYAGISFPIGPIPTAAGQVGGSGNSSKNNPPNFVQARGQTITVNVDPDKSDYLYLAGAAANGDQISQKITLKFTDGSTETWTQSFHDWASVGPPQSDATTQAHGIAQVKVAATSNIVATGLQTIDGVALVANDRVLLQNQSAPDQNGVYVVQADSWTRAPDADTSADIVDSYMTVARGTYAGKTFLNTNTGTITLGTTPITFVEGTPPQPAPRPFTGELLLKTQPERINQLGDLDDIPAHIFSYCYNLKGKQLASITLPNNENIGILSAVVAKAPVIALDGGIASLVLGTTNLTGIYVLALTIKNESNIGVGGGPLTFFFADQPEKGSTTTPPTYTTKQVTVPMGQQTTIAYIAPNTKSQMTFYVQKADGTCVGPNCSTYLPNWNNGSSDNRSYWAVNISPSLNNQPMPGQHWTMTIQNTEEGYNGYLDSPSGQMTENGELAPLPAASGNTPGGAQFKLQTQAEITAQPRWAVITETVVGGVIVGVGIGAVGVAAYGTFFVVAAAEEAVDDVVVYTIAGEVPGGAVIEDYVAVDVAFEDLNLSAIELVDDGTLFTGMDVNFIDDMGYYHFWTDNDLGYLPYNFDTVVPL